MLLSSFQPTQGKAPAARSLASFPHPTLRAIEVHATVFED